MDASTEQPVLQAGDHLKVRCELENFRKFKERRGIRMRQDIGVPTAGEGVPGGGLLRAQAWTSGPEQGRFRSRSGHTALAVRHRVRVLREYMEEMRLRAGDVLLFEQDKSHPELLRDDCYPFISGSSSVRR